MSSILSLISEITTTPLETTGAGIGKLAYELTGDRNSAKVLTITALVGIGALDVCTIGRIVRKRGTLSKILYAGGMAYTYGVATHSAGVKIDSLVKQDADLLSRRSPVRSLYDGYNRPENQEKLKVKI